MKSRQNELARRIGDSHVLFSCEGVAESVIITALVEQDLTFLDIDNIITDPLTDACYTLERKGSSIVQQYLNQDYGSDVFVLCVQDQVNHKISLGPARRNGLTLGPGTQPVHQSVALNITTHPEIEMLVICRENATEQYEHWKQSKRHKKETKLKPSLFCKEELGMSDVKERRFLAEYWRDGDKLVETLLKYQHIASRKKQHNDFMLADLLK
ncbi:hypothetical protein OZX67_00450 [Bifidobacterium sp. ESL0728]|uniref:hypothetical protein n=1 Tax=Bifidobacterium sp. ESL0728 TaxID=2983220 RepID=UPI0023F7ADCB|nr:hypothetical protein [Bifidobacterium sp. ESL0728]WEV59089.1 hypothetical protein OZX67_00450 [Bifidobacterium sp. ESL0728]